MVPAVLSLIGGLLLVGGSVPVLFASLAAFPLFVWLAMVALLMALVIPVAAVLMLLRPARHRTWGVVILAFSLLRLVWLPTLFSVYLTGFIAGTLLGAAGGVLGLVKPPAKTAQE